jgi:hypothetical protein
VAEYSPPPDIPPEDSGAFEVTEEGLRPVRKAAAAPAPRPQALGSIPLQLSLFGALLAYFIDSGEWFKTLEAYLERQQRAKVIEPYRRWAGLHPQTYEDVQANPDALAGKAVLWSVSRSTEGAFFCDGDAGKRLVWEGGESLLKERAVDAWPVLILARFEGGGESGLRLSVLEVAPPSG